MSFATTWQEAVDLLRRNLFALIVIGAIVFVPVDLVVALIDDTLGWGDVSPGQFVAVAAILIVATVIAYGAAIEAVAVEPEGAEEEPRTPLIALRDSLARFRTLVVLSVVASVAIVAGLVLLVVPGLVLLTWWLFAYQSALIESKDWRSSLGRSRDLARRDFWKVLVVVLVLGATLVAVDYVLWRIAVDVLPDTIGAWIAGVVGDTLSLAVFAAVTTAVYWQLTERSTLQET